MTFYLKTNDIKIPSRAPLAWPCFSAPRLQRFVNSGVVVPVTGVMEKVTYLDVAMESLTNCSTTFAAMVQRCPDVQTLVLRHSGVCISPIQISSARRQSSIYPSVIRQPDRRLSCVSRRFPGWRVWNLRVTSLIGDHEEQMPHLRKLCLSDFLVGHPLDAKSRAYLCTLVSIEHLHLTNTPGDKLLPVPGHNRHGAKRSDRQSVYGGPSTETVVSEESGRITASTMRPKPLMFPRLRTISIGQTFKPSDVTWLYRFVVSRESSIETVRLSPSAMCILEGRWGELKGAAEWLRSRFKVELEDTAGIYQANRKAPVYLD